MNLISVITSKELGLCGTMLGKEHPSTLTSINNLAAVLRDQGKYGQAGEMYRQALGLSDWAWADYWD
jgi:Tetratricopeptide repeat